MCKTKVLDNSSHVHNHVGMTNKLIFDYTCFNWLIGVFVFSWWQVGGRAYLNKYCSICSII